MQEARYDGKWVLTTNTNLCAKASALKYKQLWMVESIFRSMKSLLETRPIFHKCDATIRGHVFCSFLALLLRKELENRLRRSPTQMELHCHPNAARHLAKRQQFVILPCLLSEVCREAFKVHPV